jgi:chromosome segregation ATPase
MEAEKILNNYLNKLKEETLRTANEFNILQVQHTDINRLIISTSEDCRKAKAELTEYETNKLANKMFFIEQKKEVIEDLVKKKKAGEEKKKEKLDTQILDINAKISELQAENEQIEIQIKEKQKEIKQVQNLKENINEHNDKSKF